MSDAFWREIFTVTGVSALLLVPLAVLLKFLITQSLAKELTSYNVRFGLLHVKRAEVISDLYAHLKTAHLHTSMLALGAQLTDLDVQRNRANAALEAVRGALELLNTRSLWLSEPLAEETRKLLADLQGPSLSYDLFWKGKFSEDQVRSAIEQWNTKRTAIDNLLNALEKQFRSLLAQAEAG
jgi:hypothetical protein